MTKAKNGILIVLGTFLMAVSLTVFLAPNKIVAGGVSGIATVMYYIFGLPISLGVFLINIPIFVFGFIILGKKVTIKTIISTLFFTVFIEVFAFLPPVTLMPFLAAVFGGVLMGIGLGAVVLADSTTGGTDFVALMLTKKFSGLSIGSLLFLIDFSVVLISIFVFENYELGLYAIISVYIAMKAIDSIVEGVNYARAVFIISDEHEKIKNAVHTELKRGATGLLSKGMYTGNEKLTLFVVVSKREVGKLKKIVRRYDKKAFMILTSSIETLGEGFIE